MPDFFSTTNVSESVHKAFENYTHVIVNRSYRTITPIFFKSELIADLPIFIYAEWDKGTFGSRDKWQEQGGVLIDRGNASAKTGARDALVMVECPLSLDQLQKAQDGTEKQVVIFKPPGWKIHEWAVDMWFPSPEKLQGIRALLHEVPERAAMAAVTPYPDSKIVMTDSELANAVGIPAHHAPYMRRQLRAKEAWSVRARLAPTEPTLLAVWGVLTGLEVVDGVRLFTRLITPDGSPLKRPLKEMARLGYVSSARYYVYPNKEPNYRTVQKQHDKAVSDLAEMKKFIEGLPTY